MALEFQDPSWRFDAEPLSPSAVDGFLKVIRQTASQGAGKAVMEVFKRRFASAAGERHKNSSSERFVDEDLEKIADDASENAPLFIEAFVRACEDLSQGVSQIQAPDHNIVNRILMDNNVPLQLEGDALVLWPKISESTEGAHSSEEQVGGKPEILSIEDLINEMRMRLKSTDPSPLKIHTGQQKTINVSRAAADLISNFYWKRDDYRASISPFLKNLVNGRGPGAISLRRLTTFYPNDFEDLDELLVGIHGEEPWGSRGIFSQIRHESDTRTDAEIASDDLAIVESIRRKHGHPPSRGNPLVVGIGQLRRQWDQRDSKWKRIVEFENRDQQDTSKTASETAFDAVEAAIETATEEIARSPGKSRQIVVTNLAVTISAAQAMLIVVQAERPNSEEATTYNAEVKRRLTLAIEHLNEADKLIQQQASTETVSKPVSMAFLTLLQDLDKLDPDGPGRKIIDMGLGIVILTTAALFDSVVPGAATAAVMATKVFGTSAVTSVLKELRGYLSSASN